MSRSTRLFIILLLSLAAPAATFASKGFGLIENDPETAAMHGGAAALIANPAATRLNPANLSFINSSAASADVTVYDVSSDFTAPNGAKQRSDQPWKEAGSAFVAMPLSPELTLGAGIDTPYGTSMRWAPQGLFKYALPHSGDLQMLDFALSLGYKATETLRLGIEFDTYRASLNLKQFFPWLLLTGNPATPDGAMEFDGKDVRFSGGLAMSWLPAPHQHVALVMHLPTAIRFTGDFTITNIPAPLPGISARSDFAATLRMPGDLTASYAWDASEDVTVGVEAELIGNSVVDKLSVNVGGNNALFPSTVTPLNWRDSVALSAGYRQRLSPNFSILAGYQYTKSPMNSTNYTPLIAGNDRHLISAGLAYTSGRFSMNFGYNFGLHPDLVITHNAVPAFNGRHEFNLQVFSFGCGVRF